MLVLDTNHLTEYDRASIIGERLRQRLAASGDVAVTTIVSAEEQMRGWLARINAERDVRRQFHAYERLHGRIRFFNDWVLLPWDEDAANLFADLRRTLRRMSTMDLKIACITLQESSCSGGQIAARGRGNWSGGTRADGYDSPMNVTLDVPEELLADVFHVPTPEVPRQVRIELACALYARGAMTHAQSAKLAALDRFEMGDELARRNIPRHYGDADVAADLAYGRGQ